MKEVLGFIAALLAVVLIGYGGWYWSNSRFTMQLPPDQAAITVAQRYDGNRSGTFAARHTGTSTNELGARATYIVSRDGSDVARVTLKRFQKVGWQEAAYERLEQNSSNATK